MNETNEDITGIKSVEGNTVTISDTKKFTKHAEKRMAELEKEQAEKVSELKILEVSLHPIHLACLDDDLRPNMKLIEIKNNIATATNGNIIVKIDLSMVSPFTPDMLKIINGKYVHMEVWKEMSKCDSLELDDSQIICNKKGINKIFEYSDPLGEFFKINDVIIDTKEAGEEKKRLMSYSPKYIGTIASIFKTEILHFSFSKGDNGTFVFPEDGGGMFALLIPVFNEEIPNRYFFV